MSSLGCFEHVLSSILKKSDTAQCVLGVAGIWSTWVKPRLVKGYQIEVHSCRSKTSQLVKPVGQTPCEFQRPRGWPMWTQPSISSFGVNRLSCSIRIQKSPHFEPKFGTQHISAKLDPKLTRWICKKGGNRVDRQESTELRA